MSGQARRRLGAALALALAASASMAPLGARAAEVAGARAVAQRVVERDRLSVIAQLRPAGDASRASADRVRAAADNLARRMSAVGVTSVRPIGTMPFVVLEVDRQQLRALVESGLVVSVEENLEVGPLLAESTSIIRAPQAQDAGARGLGQVVAIVDTGVDDTHPFLAGRLAAGVCTAPDCSDGTTPVVGPTAGRPCSGDCSHGTHIAGIAVGRQVSGAPANGVAPDARYISARAFDGATTTTDRILLALDTIAGMAGSYKIAAVTFSLGTTTYRRAYHCDSELPAYAAAVNNLVAKGVAFVAASGNEGDSAGLSAPACLSKAVAVGRTDDSDRVPPASNSAPILDLLAPGTYIVSSAPGGGYVSKSGTSMAAAHVAGAVAALRSKVASAGAAQVEQSLKSTGKPVTDPRNGVVTPRIDVFAALGALGSAPGWKPFESAGGNLASFPECLTTGSVQIDCWAKGDGFALIWNRRTNGTWSGWRNLGGNLLSPPSCVQRGTRTHCMAIGLSGALTQFIYDGTFWSAPIGLGGAYVARPSCLGAADGVSIACFAVGTDKALRQIAYDGRSWKTPVNLGGSTTFRPRCQLRAGGTDCYIIDSAGKLLTRRLSGGKPGAWVTIGGSLATTPHCINTGSVAECYAQGRDNTLQAVRYDGKKWGKFTNLGGGVASQPSCLVEAAGARSCFSASLDNRLLQFRSVDGRWQTPVSLGGSVQARPSCLASNGGARIDCFLQGKATPAMQQIAYY